MLRKTLTEMQENLREKSDQLELLRIENQENERNMIKNN